MRIEGVTAALAVGVRDVARLVLPVECPGCGRWDELLCDACAQVLAGHPRRCEAQVPRLDRIDGRAPLPVWAVAGYAGPTRGIVVSWKDRGRADLTPRLVAAMHRAGTLVGPVLGEAAGSDVVRVVPVPSSPGARRRRGTDLVRLLAEGTAQGLRTAGVAARVAPVLRRRRGGRDQVGLGARARGSNTAGSVRLRAGGRPPDGVLHVLVDDVVTTGATLAACETALSGSGGLVLAGLVLAATPPPSKDRGPVPRRVPGD